MNWKWLSLVVCLVVAACGGKTESKNEEEYVANSATDTGQPAAVDPVALGEALVKQNDCNTCHHKTNTLIGPAHTAVAQKYEFTEANVKLLAEKITKGGSGVWGQIPMAAHLGLSQDDAEAMARYVLSLDGEKEH
ncbi:MAG: cytochrome c class I [Cyclobacteriaceae bacterium]|nr:cytochrome c class I [Cyclobacteriaceae bacterium]